MPRKELTSFSCNASVVQSMHRDRHRGIHFIKLTAHSPHPLSSQGASMGLNREGIVGPSFEAWFINEEQENFERDLKIFASIVI